MTCPLQTEETDLLLDYSAGRLDARRTAILAQHMENCPECASFRLEQKAVWDALDLWEPAPVSMDFNRRLWQRIGAAASAPWYIDLAESLRFANWKPAIPLTAAILMIAAGFLLDHPGTRTSATGVSVREADQVEQTLDDIQLLHQLDAVTPPGAPDEKRGDSKPM
jgi:anti-sigma factor RsiW